MLNKVFELICGFGPQQETVGSCISQGKGQGKNLQSRIYRQGQAQLAKVFGSYDAKIMPMPTRVHRISNTIMQLFLFQNAFQKDHI